MHVDEIRIALLKIMLEFAHVNQEPRVIHCWAVFQFNIVQLTTNVRPEQFVGLAFAQQFVHRIVNVSLTNCAYKEFVSQHAMTIQLVPISNSVRIMCAHKRFDAVAMTIACSMNIALSTRTVDLNVKMLAKDDSYADEMPNVQLEITRDCVHVKKVLPMMARVDVVELNANVTMNAVRINSVTRIFVNWSVRVVNRVAKKQFALLKVIVRYATVNRATVVIHMNSVMQLIIVVIHLAALALCAPITKEHSTVHAAMGTLVIHIMKDVAWHLNVKAMLIVQQVPNVFNRIVNQNVEMFVKMSTADQILIASLRIISAFVNVYLAMVVKRLIRLSAADHCQFHVHCLPTAQPIRIAMVAFVNQHAF